MGKWCHFLESNWCQLKQSSNTWICECAGKWVGVKNGIILLEGKLAAKQLPLKMFILCCCCSTLLLLFSHLVVSDSSQPHGLTHTRFLCLSPSPGVCPSSCSLYQWCHPAISSSVVPFPFCLKSFPASGSFLMSWFFVSGSQSIGALASVLPMTLQDWFPLGSTCLISLLSKGFILAVQGVHTWLSAVPNLRIFVKEMLKVVCKDLASGIFNTELSPVANYLTLPKYPAIEDLLNKWSHVL